MAIKRMTLRTIVLLRVLPIAGVLLVLIWLAVKFLAADTVRLKVEEQLVIKADQAGETVGRKLAVLVETVRGISENNLVVNGLIDAGARDNYLPIFLKSLRLPGTEAFHIALTDYKGRVLASNRAGDPGISTATWFPGVMAGKAHVQASKTGIRIAQPVFYNGLAEGVLAVRCDAAALAELVSLRSPDASFIIMENDNTIIFSSHPSFQSSFDTRTPGWLYQIASIKGFPNLLAVCAEDENAAFESLVRLDNFLLAAMFLDLAALCFGVILAALLATRPLNRFVLQIETIHQTEDLDRDVSKENYRSRELAFLVDAFNNFIGRIREYQDNLHQLVRERTEKLEISEAKTRSILETVLSGIVTIDTHRCIETFNPAAEQIFGYTLDEVRGEPVTILMPDNIAEEHDRYVNRYQQTGEKRIIGVGGREVEGRRRNGTLFPLELAVSDMGGGRFVGVLNDITVRKQWEHDLKEARKTAEEANKTKMEFLAMMSHELKTPLSVMDNIFQEFASVSIFAGVKDLTRQITAQPKAPEMMAALDELVEEILELSQEGRDAGKRLLTLIQDILDFSKIEAGKLQVELSSCDLEVSINKAVREIRPLAEAKNLTVTTDIAPLSAYADSHRLLQIMANLLSNAVKFTDTGGITIVVSASGNMAQIAVIDTGCGIPQERAEAIFNAFEQVDMSATRKHGGTGLGMPITRKLVEQMGGKIEFHSREGHGTTFTFTLPLFREEQGEHHG